MNIMRSAVLLALVVSTPLLAADTHRYLVATRHTPRTLHLVRDVDDAGHQVREFSNFDAFGADLTDDEASALRRSPDVRYVPPPVGREAHGPQAAQPRSEGS